MTANQPLGRVNATTVFSFWPEVKVNAAEYGPLRKAGCLINTDLSGFAIDSTPEHCRTMIWNEYIKPRVSKQRCLLFAIVAPPLTQSHL